MTTHRPPEEGACVGSQVYRWWPSPWSHLPTRGQCCKGRTINTGDQDPRAPPAVPTPRTTPQSSEQGDQGYQAGKEGQLTRPGVSVSHCCRHGDSGEDSESRGRADSVQVTNTGPPRANRQEAPRAK